MKLSLAALALGTFAVGTAELMVAGILPLMATDLNVTVGTAGQLVSVYAIVFAIGAPLLTALTARFNRRSLLLAALLLFIVGNILAISLPSYALLMTARVLAACGSALVSVLATVVAANIVPDEKRGWAISVVVAGWSASAVFGAPIGTFVGQNWGWRMSFVLVIVLTAVAFAGIWAFVPKVSGQPSVKSGNQLRLICQPVILAALAASVFFLGGQYVFYTYFAAFLQNVTHLDGATISFVLLVYGIAGTAGNFLGGYGADHWGASRTLIIGAVVNSSAMLIIPFAGNSLVGTVLITALWSLSSWSFTSSQQYHLLKLGGSASQLILSLNLSAFNIGIAGGSAFGGFILTTTNNFSATGWGGGTVVVVALMLMVAGIAMARQPHSNSLSQPEIFEAVADA